MAKNEHAPPAQQAEQRMRDERDRKTQGPKGAPGEPRFRDGADKDMHPDDARSGEGWAETPGAEEPPRRNKRGSSAPH